MQQAELFVDILIPNWNGAQMLRHCLHSLSQQSFQGFRVTVIDNGSTDDSVDMLEEEFPAVQIIQFETNTGFSAAVNAGIKRATAPLILLLNNDMEVPPDCLEALVQGAELYREYDYFALKMLDFHKRTQLDGAGDAFFRGGAGYRIGTQEQDGERYQKDREVFGACAGAALYRDSFFQKVGFFDVDFFAYLEDVDLNVRARRLGLRCMYLYKAKVFHIGSATSGSKINPLTIRLSTRNSIYLLLKNYPPSFFVIFGPVIVLYQCIWLLFCCKKKMLGPWLQGMKEAVTNRSLMLEQRQDSATIPGVLSSEMLIQIFTQAEREAVLSIISRRAQNGKKSRLLTVYLRLFC